MANPNGHAFDPDRPWPTRVQETGRIIRLLVVVAALQFLLSAFQLVLRPQVMFWVWLVPMVVVASATVRIERYFAKRRS